MKRFAFPSLFVLLSALASASFAQNAGSWGPATLISEQDFLHRMLLLTPQATITADGVAAVAWAQSFVPGTSLQFELKSRQFVPRSGWQNVQDLGVIRTSILEPIGRNEAGVAALPYFNFAPSGEFLRTFSPETGWSDAPFQLNDSLFDNGSNVRVAVDKTGNMIAIRNAFPLGRHQIFARRFDAATGWQPNIVIVDKPMTGGASDIPGLAMNEAGEAVVVWRSKGDRVDHNVLFSRFFDPASGWGDIVQISADDQIPALSEHLVTMDAKGNVQVIYDDAGAQVRYLQYFKKNTGWRIEALVLDDNPKTYLARRKLASNDFGQSIIVWMAPAFDPAEGGEVPALYYRRFLPDFEVLTDARAFRKIGDGLFDEALVSLDNKGKALLIFDRVNKFNELVVEGLQFSSVLDTWSDHQVLFTQPIGGSANNQLFSFSLAANTNGTAVATWGIKNDVTRTGSVFASMFERDYKATSTQVDQ